MIETNLLIREQALALAQNIITFGVWHLNLKENKLEWDDKMFEIYEKDRSTFTGKVNEFERHIHREDLDYVNTLMKYAAAQTNTLHASFRIITDAGNTKYIDGNIQPITDFNGTVIGFIGVNKDITAQKLNETAKMVSEENYKQLLREFSKLSVVAQKTLNAVIITDPVGVIEWVNDSFTKMTGRQLHEVKGRKPGDILQGSETDPLSIQFMSNCIKQQKSFEITVLNYKKNGEKYWVDIIANPYFSGTGELEGFISVQNEVTERKRMEDRVRNERDRAKMYLDVVGSIVLILNCYGEVMLANKTALRLLGLHSADEIIGKNWFDKYLPAELQAGVHELFAQAVEGKADIPEFVENEIIGVSGNRRLIEWHNVMLKDDNGKITGCLSAGKDITEQRQMELALKESQEFYRSVFDGSMNAVLLADDDNHYLDANPAAEQLLGYTKEELQGMSVTDLATDTKIDMLNDLWSSFMDARHQTGIIELKRKDGKKVIVEYRATANIKPGVHLSVLIDVTDKIKYQNEIARQNKALREIAWMQSHEIRKPVANILGLFELLKMETAKHDSDVLQLMLQSVLELDEMIKELVVKSRKLEL